MAAHGRNRKMRSKVYYVIERLIAEGRVQSATRPHGPAPDPVQADGTVSDLVADQRR
jgi:hypothetical protein